MSIYSQYLTWTQLSGTMVVPTGTAKISAEIVVHKYSDTGALIYFDDASVALPAGKAILSNGLVEVLGASTSSTAYFSELNSDSQSRFSITVDGTQSWGDGSSSVDTNLYRGAANELVTDDLFIAGLGVIPQISGSVESWHTVSLSASWTNRGAGFPSMSYRLMADPPNSVMICGEISSGTTTNGTTIFTLPSGYRPTSEQILICAYSAGTRIARLQITTGGSVNIFDAGGTTPTAGVLQVNSRFPTDV